MGAFVRVGGVWEAFDPRVNVEGIWENVQTGFVNVAGIWEVFYSALTPATVEVSPDPVAGSGQGDVVSDPATATVSDGVGPFTYQWAHVSGDIFTINAPTNATTTFGASVGASEELTGIYQVTVTDTGNGNETSTDTVSVTLLGST